MIGINDIDDDDLTQEEELVENLVNGTDNEESNNEELKTSEEESQHDALTTYLIDNGISDINKIKFTDDEGNIEERSWNDLSGEEQYNILNSTRQTTTVENPDTGLDEEEIRFINELRKNGLTPSQYIQSLQVNEVPVTEPTFSTDELSDDELYLLDLETLSPDMTQEEALEALEIAKTNEDLFNKQMIGMRDKYKQMETNSREQEEALAQQEQQEQFRSYANSITEEISNFNNIGDLDINMSSDDMDELAGFILSSDNQGINPFRRALSDPTTQVRMAWFALHGEDIFNNISDYYNKEIQKASRAGFEKGKASVQQNQSAVVIQPRKANKNIKVKSINDLDF